MKKHLLLLFLTCSVLFAAAQDSDLPPFKRIPGFPNFDILLGDSTTLFNKTKLSSKKPLLLMVFSPDCSHCQHETEQLVANRSKLKDVQIVMITLHPLWAMNDFIKKYKLNTLSNVTVGKDFHYFTPTYFGIHNLPFVALYDKKGKLIQSGEGNITVPKAIALFKANK